MCSIAIPSFVVPDPEPVAFHTVTVVEALTADGAVWTAVSIGGLPPAEAAALLRAALDACAEEAAAE